MKNKVKPIAKVTGNDGNVFVTLGICTTALKKEGMGREASDMIARVFDAEDYYKAIKIMGEYCTLR